MNTYLIAYAEEFKLYTAENERKAFEQWLKDTSYPEDREDGPIEGDDTSEWDWDPVPGNTWVVRPYRGEDAIVHLLLNEGQPDRIWRVVDTGVEGSTNYLRASSPRAAFETYAKMVFGEDMAEATEGNTVVWNGMIMEFCVVSEDRSPGDWDDPLFHIELVPNI